MTSTLEDLATRLQLVLECLESLDNPALFRPKVAAERLGISLTQLRRLVRDGRIGTVPWGSKRMVPAAEVRRLARDGIPDATRRSSPGRLNIQKEAAMVRAALRGRR